MPTEGCGAPRVRRLRAGAARYSARVRRAAALLALLACGTDLTALDRVDSALTGAWDGPATLALPGATDAAPLSLVAVAAEDRLTIVPFCRDGSGALVATGHGSSVSWGGTLECPPAAVGGCPELRLTWRKATFTLGADGTLAIAAEGEATGCGAGPAALAATLTRS